MDNNNPNKNLTIGIIGGMGPAATLDIFSKILALTPANCDEEHLNIQIDNNPIPGANRVPLCERARRMEICGADFIIIPCNAAHEHFDAVQASVNIPVVNMIRESVRTIANNFPHINRVGIMAWHKTLSAGLYQKMLIEYGIKPIIPNQSDWQTLINLINAVKSGKGLEEKPEVIALGEKLVKEGVQAIILGCTELPIMISQKDFQVPTIDATLVLAQTAVNLALGKITIDEISK